MSNCSPPTFVFTTPPSCPKQQNKKGKSKKCSAQGPKKKLICLDMNGLNQCGGNQSGDKKKNFMEDVWKAMTPDMLNKLVDILVKDFNMSRAEACNFVKHQKDLSKQSQMASSGKCPCASDMVPAIPNMDVRNGMVREFMDLTACKVSDYMAMVLCSRKTRRYKVMSKIMIDSINSMFGVQESDDSPLSRLTAFIADKMALWLDSLFDDYKCPDEDGEKLKIDDSTNEDEKPPEDDAVEEPT